MQNVDDNDTISLGEEGHNDGNSGVESNGVQARRHDQLPQLLLSSQNFDSTDGKGTGENLLASNPSGSPTNDQTP